MRILKHTSNLMLLCMVLVLLFIVGAQAVDVPEAVSPALYQQFEQFVKDNAPAAEITAVKPLDDLQGDEFYCIETKPTGYYIYAVALNEFLEYSESAPSPYAGHDGNLYFFGMLEYYYEENGVYINPVTNAVLSKEDLTLRSEPWGERYKREVQESIIDNGLEALAGKVTRGHFIMCLYQIACSPDVKIGYPFTDVPASADCAKAISWAYQIGIINGITPSTFDPNATITWEHAVRILYRYAQYLGLPTLTAMNIGSLHYNPLICAEARQAWAWVVGSGIANVDISTLPPQNSLQWETVVDMMNRLYYEVNFS